MLDDKSKIKVCLIMGYPVKNSKSPAMHSAAYKSLGIEDQFIFLPSEVKPEKLEEAVNSARKLKIRGFSVTMPHKETIIKYIDTLDDAAEEIGAVNTVLNDEDELIGFNTDWLGFLQAIKKKTELTGKKTAVIGAGGAARAIVYALVNNGADVKIFNRSINKAEDLAKEFGTKFGGLEDLSEVENYDIIVNASSIGMNEEISPVNKNLLNKNQIVFDIVYTPKETQLLKDARDQGAEIIYGYEMLLYQGAEQFKMFTGFEAPLKDMEQALLKDSV